MNTLIAGSTRLEPQAALHAEEMFAVLSDPAIYEFENEPPASREWLKARYTQLESRASRDGSEAWLNWVIRLPSSELAGYVQATVLAEGRAYVAYELASRFWRQGIASAAVGAVLEELAARYAVREVFAVLKAANYRSLGLLRKLGFSQPGAEVQPPWHPESDEVVMHKSLAVAKHAA